MQNRSDQNSERVRRYHKIFDGKKVYLDYPPLWVTVGITGNCAFKCDFCCSHSPDSGKDSVTSHQYKIPFNMSIDDFQRIVKLCHDGGVPHIHICGTGEPFLHPHILDIIDYLSEIYPYDISLQTDFHKVIFDKHNFLDEIIRRKTHICRITTDIFPENVHNKIKKGSDIDYLLECLEKISLDTDISIDAHIILNKYSYNGINDLVKLMHTRQIRFSMNIVNIFPLGFNDFTSLENAYMPSDMEITRELDNLRKLAKSLNVMVRIPPPWDRENIQRKPCMMFWQKVQIMPSKKLPKERWIGNAIPQQCNAAVCGELYSMGNILDYENFMDFWNNNKYLSIRRQIVEGKVPDDACRNCYTGCYGEFKKLTAKAILSAQFLGFLHRNKQLLLNSLSL